MRTSVLLIVCLMLTATADAGGLFRRVPEVGEWATFEMNSKTEFIRPGSRGSTIELDGTFTVRCVGEETVEDRRHLWIEWEVEAPVPEEGVTFRKIWKALVPENVLTDDDPSLDGIRGWAPNPTQGRGPVEFSAPDGDLAALNNLAYVLLGGGEPGDSAQRTIEVNGQEHVLTQSESGPVPQPYAIENEIVTSTSEGTWWVSEDLAFGVAVIEMTASSVNHEDEREMHMEMRFDLVETGTGAVSDLPDHN
jgi:hypothetical protein